MIYISTFIAGTKDIVAARLKKEKNGRIIGLFDSLVLYELPSGDPSVENLRYVNNSFVLIKKLKPFMAFKHAVDEICTIQAIPVHVKKEGSFRIVYSEENSFIPIPDRQRRRAELFVAHKTKLKISRSKPDLEFWVIKDRVGSYFAQRITAKNASKGLQKGELRPELADIMCYLATIHKNDVICDPFCGYGAILKGILHYGPKKIIGRDIDAGCIKYCRETIAPPNGKKTSLLIKQADLLMPGDALDANSIDTIITDPPWGAFDKEIDGAVFYRTILAAMYHILKDGGILVILVSRLIPFEEISKEKNAFTILRKYGILVNGKKAALYTLKKNMKGRIK